MRNLSDNKYLWVKKPNLSSRVTLNRIHFLNLSVLKNYLNEVNKIKHRFVSKLSRLQQDLVTREVKIARQLGLLPFKM